MEVTAIEIMSVNYDASQWDRKLKHDVDEAEEDRRFRKVETTWALLTGYYFFFIKKCSMHGRTVNTFSFVKSETPLKKRIP